MYATAESALSAYNIRQIFQRREASRSLLNAVRSTSEHFFKIIVYLYSNECVFSLEMVNILLISRCGIRYIDYLMRCSKLTHNRSSVNYIFVKPKVNAAA